MLKLMDGLAEGAYACKRSPYFLRAVQDAHTEHFDVLDLLDDEPTASEAVVEVYRKTLDRGIVHVNTGRRAGSGFYQAAEYERVDVAPTDTRAWSDLRDTAVWRAWALANIPAELRDTLSGPDGGRMSDDYHILVDIRAWCETCDWKLEARNAQGVAAQHARRYGHTTRGEKGYAFRYTG